MENKYHLIITAEERIQPTVEEMHNAIRELIWKKVDAALNLPEEGGFQIDLITDFSKKNGE